MGFSYPIILNKSNYESGSTFVYKFGRSVDMSDVSIALGSISLFYSWRNITAIKGNNSFQIIHPATGATNVTLTITLPDGGYEIDDINDYIKYYLVTNGYYIQNSSTLEYVVYAELRVNPSTYSIEFVSYPVPTALPAGYTAGSSITFPASTRGPQLTVTTAAFGSIIGFVSGASYPTTQQAVVSTTTSTSIPVLSDVQNVVVRLNSASNWYAPNGTILHSFGYGGVNYAQLITNEPNELSYVPQQTGFRTELRLQLCDQLFRPLNILDTDVTIKLLLQKDEKSSS